MEGHQALGTEVRRAGGLGDWNNLRKQLLRMPGTGSPQAQKGSTKWLLTRTSIHRVVLLSTLGFYILTHTHTHTHNLFLRSSGLTGMPRAHSCGLTHTRVASPRAARSQTQTEEQVESSGGFPHFLNLASPPSCWNEFRPCVSQPQLHTQAERGSHPVHTPLPACPLPLGLRLPPPPGPSRPLSFGNVRCGLIPDGASHGQFSLPLHWFSCFREIPQQGV